MDIKKRIQELSLDQKAKLYFMGLVRQGKIDTLPEDPKAAYIKMVMDKADPADMHDDPGDIRIDHDYYTEEKDDYGRSISGKDKRTFVDPKDLTPAARAKKMAQAAYDKAEMNGDIRGMELALAAMDIDKPIPGLNKGLKEGYNKVANKLYGVNYDKLSPLEQEYVRDTIDMEPGGAFNPRSAEDLSLEPEEEDSYRDMIQGKYSDDDLSLEPEDDEYEDGTPFYGDDDDLRLEPELDEMQMVNKKTGKDVTKYVLQLLQGEISKEEFEKITGLKKETRDEEDEENDRNLAVDDIPDSLREIATELGYLKEGIDPNSEIADYVEAMFNDSVVEKEGFQSDIWTKAEYAATSRGEGSVFMDLAKHLNSVGGKDVLEGNPDIYLELLSNGDIQWSADVTLNENLNEEKNCGCGKNPCETYGTINEGKVDISYTDPGFRFYKMKVDGKRLDREEGTEYLKGLGIDMEIPRSYNETILDKIVSQLKEKGIDADHDAAMDVS